VNKILVIGSYNVGLTVFVEKLPSVGETVIGGGYTQGPGGKGSNQAIAASKLGGRVEFVGAVGDDEYGNTAFELWDRMSVKYDHVKKVKKHTGIGLIFVDRTGKNMIAVDPGANLEFTEQDVEAIEGTIAEAGVVLLQQEMEPAVVSKAAALAKRHGTKVILNPAPSRQVDHQLLRNVDILTPNEIEISQFQTKTDDLEQTCSELLTDGVTAVIVTLGERGAHFHTSEDCLNVPAPDVAAVDPTGAGDAFNGALAVALMEGEPLRQAVTFANYAGALTVTRKEVIPALPSRAELEEFRRNITLE
jgi:ribokinase